MKCGFAILWVLLAFNMPVLGYFGGASEYLIDCCALNLTSSGSPIDSEQDTDNDGIPDSVDIDDDNDGILDFHEELDCVDCDGDGLPNSKDIDSDNDGIPDYIEWQFDGENIPYSYVDSNVDGWDDAFDPALDGIYHEAADTDFDGIPDFLDTDSDNDGISDFIESNDIDNDAVPNTTLKNSDLDSDGLDDNVDYVFGWDNKLNPMGSRVILPDNNENNIRDWRDFNNYSSGIEFELEGEQGKVLVLPNPVSDICTIVLPKLQNASTNTIVYVRLYSLDGKLMTSKTAYGRIIKMDLSRIPKGSYLIHVRRNLETLSTRLLKTP